MNSEDFISGELVLIDKEKGWSSFDVVNKIRGAIKKKFLIKKIKVGHAGTLDPLATGLLILCTGKMTKKIDHLSILKKKYIGTITLGATTPSYDCETEVDKIYPTNHNYLRQRPYRADRQKNRRIHNKKQEPADRRPSYKITGRRQAGKGSYSCWRKRDKIKAIDI